MAYSNLMGWLTPSIKDEAQSIASDNISETQIEPIQQNNTVSKTQVFELFGQGEEQWIEKQEILNWLVNRGYIVEWYDPISIEEVEVPEIPEDREWLDIGLEAAEALQSFWKAIKIESKLDIDPRESKTLWGSFKNEAKRLLNAARFAANLPWDTVELSWELLWLASNVVWTARWIKDIWVWLADKFGLVEWTEEQKAMIDAIWTQLKESFWTWEDALETIAQNPLDSLTVIFGWASAAKSWIRATKFGQTPKWQNLITKLEKIEDVTNPLNIVKWELALGKKVATIAWKPVKLLWEWYVKTTWVNLDTVKAITKNPKAFKQAEVWVITRQTVADDIVKAIDKKAADISDIGKEYAKVRKLKSNMTPDDIWDLKAKVNVVLDANDIDVVKWKLDFTNSQIGTAWNRKAIQDAYNLIHTRTKFWEWKDLLNLRQSIDDTINYKSDATTRAQKIVRDMRGQVDEIAKDKLEWLRKLDAKFWPERTEFNKISSTIYNKDWSLKDNYISTIANITWKGKELKFERLRKISPELEVQTKALKALEDVQIAKGNKIGSYMSAWVVWGAWVAWGIPAAIGAYIVTHPWTLVNVLKGYTWVKNIIKSIVDKVKVWTKLNADEAVIVWKAIQSQVKEWTEATWISTSVIK